MNGEEMLARAIRSGDDLAGSGNLYTLPATVETTSPLTVKLSADGAAFPARPGAFTLNTVGQNVVLLIGQGRRTVIDAF